MSDLSAQPPPRKGAKEGFYPDPLNTGRARWWDGANWTYRMGPEHTGKGPKGTPVTTPTKRCRHCGTESETFDDNCPNCGKPYGMSRRATVGIIVAATLGALLLLGGCAAVIVAGIDDLEDSTITRDEYEAVTLGVTRDELEADLGEPSEVGEFNEGSTHVTCLYYNEEGRTGFDDPYLQFCFVGGILDSKFAPAE